MVNLGDGTTYVLRSAIVFVRGGRLHLAYQFCGEGAVCARVPLHRQMLPKRAAKDSTGVGNKYQK